MSYEEFVEFYIKRTKNLEIMSKWKKYIAETINQGKLEIEDKDYVQTYNEYQNSTENKERTSKLLELVEIYERYLINGSTVKYE